MTDNENLICRKVQKGDYNGALEILEAVNKAIKECSYEVDDFGYIHLHRQKVECLYVLGRYEEAIDCCNTLIKIQPDNFADYREKGYCLSKLRRYEEAIDCFNVALINCPQVMKANTFIMIKPEMLREILRINFDCGIEVFQCFFISVKINKTFSFI